MSDSDSGQSIVSPYLTIMNDLEHDNTIRLSFSVELSPYWVALITKELALYVNNILELEIDEPFYISKDGEISMGDQAFFNKMLDKSFFHHN